MDGFVRTKIDPLTTEIVGGVAMGYWQEEDLPFYYSVYRQFPIADRYFCSLLGQTFPNRRYLLAATSIGQIDDLGVSLTDYPANGTIFDQFDAHGITWKDYFTTTPSTELFPKLFLDNKGTKVVPIGDFFTDAAAGTLPDYCLVEPDYGTQSEENPQNIALGEEFAASVVNAVINGPDWDRTLLILTYDEHGGYYDHVPPPAAIPPDSIGPSLVDPRENPFDGFARYGFRVPFAIVSPWARRHYVSHRVFDHTSILKLAETKWNLPALTYRDANALPMLDMLDFRRPAFAEPKLAQPLALADPSALSCSVNGPGTIPPPGSISPKP
jgi:phospholipase C